MQIMRAVVIHEAGAGNQVTGSGMRQCSLAAAEVADDFCGRVHALNARRAEPASKSLNGLTAPGNHSGSP